MQLKNKDVDVVCYCGILRPFNVVCSLIRPSTKGHILDLKEVGKQGQHFWGIINS